jgi:hypothetical protein
VSSASFLQHETLEKIDAMKGVSHKKLVGNLMYVMVTIRSDLSNVVDIISQFMQDPSLKHWVAAKKVIRYLNHIQSLWYNTQNA